MHKLIEGCTCGDKVCDEAVGENKCTCAKDCGECKGALNELVESKCIDDICVSSVKSTVNVLNQTVIRAVKTSYFNIDLKITYLDPLNVEVTPVVATFRLDDISTSISNLKITGITVMDDKQVLLSEITFVQPVSKIGFSFEKSLSLKGYQNIDTKKKKTLIMEVAYEYDQVYGSQTRTIRSSVKNNFGPMLLIAADMN
jgi:hypothetical protein